MNENISNMDLTEPSTKAGQKYRLDNISFRSKNGTGNSSSSFTIVVYEGRGNDRGQIGMASIDLRYSELNLCQFVDTSSYTLLKIRLSLCDPLEVILPESGVTERSGVNRGVLTELLSNSYKDAQICPLHKKYFNDSRGIELIKQLGIPECSNIDKSVLNRYYCMAAAAALLKYVEYIQNVLFAQHSLKIVYEAIEDSCLIDVNSWRNLELIQPTVKRYAPVKGTESTSMFELLNHCVTPGGARTLRSCLLQPCADPDVINVRLDVVQEFVNSLAMLDRLRSSMSGLHDLQQLITLCVYTNLDITMTREESIRSIRNKIYKVIELKRLLSIVKSVSTILSQSKNQFLQKCRERLCDPRLDEIAQVVNAKIDTTINSTSRKRKSSMGDKDSILFAISSGQHVLLDLARRAYEELRSHVLELQTEEQTGVEGAVLAFNHTRGYHYNLPSNDPLSVRLPNNCIQVVRNRSSISFTTRDLIKYNDRLVQSENEILLKSNLVLDQLISSIRLQLPALYSCVELLSLLDFFTSLAFYASRSNTVRPIFGNEMVVRQGRHPILDAKLQAVPNDTHVLPDARFCVIAGPNMAGKSTYMQQVCLLQILAQCGCFVPADFACFVPMNRVFSRVGHNDDLCQGLSGFAVEMSEMSVILQNANDRTMIIIDELARSTSTEEGIGVSYALCEELIRKKAFVFFATHFLDLSMLELNYPIVRNFHLSLDLAPTPNNDGDGGKGEITAKRGKSHILYKGRYKGPLYGLDLAELTTLPESITKSARAMAERLRTKNIDTSAAAEVNEIICRKKLTYLAHRIAFLSRSAETMSDRALSAFLKDLQVSEADDDLF